jgi:hypothetical protein
MLGLRRQIIDQYMTRYYFTHVLRLLKNRTAAFVINATGAILGVVYCLLLILDVQDKMSYNPSPIMGDLHNLNAYYHDRIVAIENKNAIPTFFTPVCREQVRALNTTPGVTQPCPPAELLPASKRAPVTTDSILSEIPGRYRNTENPKKALV